MRRRRPPMPPGTRRSCGRPRSSGRSPRPPACRSLRRARLAGGSSPPASRRGPPPEPGRFGDLGGEEGDRRGDRGGPPRRFSTSRVADADDGPGRWRGTRHEGPRRAALVGRGDAGVGGASVGGSPLRRATAVAARPKTSAAGLGFSPAATSGETYPIVPSRPLPAWVPAMSKSTSTTRPFGVRTMLAGLTSPWTIDGSWPWRWSRAATSSASVDHLLERQARVALLLQHVLEVRAVDPVHHDDVAVALVREEVAAHGGESRMRIDAHQQAGLGEQLVAVLVGHWVDLQGDEVIVDAVEGLEDAPRRPCSRSAAPRSASPAARRQPPPSASRDRRGLRW